MTTIDCSSPKLTEIMLPEIDHTKDHQEDGSANFADQMNAGYLAHKMGA